MDGKALAAEKKARVARAAAALPRPAGLAVVLAGDGPAARAYLRGKERDCAQCGIRSVCHCLPSDVSEQALLGLVQELGRQEEVDGILIQLPLPGHLAAGPVLRAIAPEKDVECVHPFNVGRFYGGDPAFLPCTPAAVMALLAHYRIPVEGRRCAVLGRSDIVGKPTAALLTQANGTVTLCHSGTEDLPSVTRQADILVTAMGRRGAVTAEMVKEGAAVIDVSILPGPAGGLCGDVEAGRAAQRCAYITPVPGGVGPVTRAVLMENVLTAARRRLGLE